MSGTLLPLKTYASAGSALWAAAGSGGGGGGQNLVVSTIVMEGSTDPLEITLPATANDGFSVRQGGATNPLAILTIDAANGGQAEFGIRSLSTISGNPVPRGRFEQTLVPGTDLATLSYTLDTAGAGNASTIGSVQFKKGDLAGNFGGVVVTGESGLQMNVGGGNGTQVFVGAPATCLIPKKSPVQNSGNIYVPAAGTSQTVTTFSTIAGHVYELYVPQLRVQNQPAGAVQAGAWSDMSIDTSPAVTYLDTFDMASVSTVTNDLQLSRGYTFIATGTGHNMVASGNPSNSLSTAMTFGNAEVLLRDLGQLSGLQSANLAP